MTVPKPFLRRRQQNQIKAAEAANARALAAVAPGPREMEWADIAPGLSANTPIRVIFADPLDDGRGCHNEPHCPRCGKALKLRGAHFHIRACKGVSDGG